MNANQAVKNINVSLENSYAISTGCKYVWFSDLHYNKDGGRNDSKPYLQLQRDKVFPYYLRQGYRGVVSEVFDLIEARTFDAIWDYTPNRPNIRLLTQLLDVCIPGNHDRKIGSSKHTALSGWKFADAIRLYDMHGVSVGLSVHGYQADAWNSGKKLTSVVNWVVRHVWAEWQDRHSAASNLDLGNEIEQYFMGYAGAIGNALNRPYLILMGHTHMAKLYRGYNSIYANTGCWTIPNGGHCIEMRDEKLCMIKWDMLGNRHVMSEVNLCQQ